MQNNSQDTYLLDSRDDFDICNRIKELAKSYTPEWNFEEKNPDIGSTIAIIYADQMEENISRFNQVLDKYYIELVNMMGISLKSARPSTCAVIMELLGDTVEGSMIPKNTKLIGEANPNKGEEHTNNIVFETTQDIFVTGTKLIDVFQISQELGNIQIFQEKENMKVFDFLASEKIEHKLLIYHKHMFDVENETIYLKFESTNEKSLNKLFFDRSQFRFCNYINGEICEFDSVEYKEEQICLNSSNKSDTVVVEGEEYKVIILEALNAIHSVIELKDIQISASGIKEKAQFICNQIMDKNCKNFKPFGEELSLFDELFIGNDKIFSKAGSLVTISFQLSMEEKYVGFIRKEKNENLKIIKKKPREVTYTMEAETFIQEITIEYYNGRGFKTLTCLVDMSTLFNGKHNGNCEIQFICPEDIKEFSVLGNEGKCIRMQIHKADNCYMNPCIHHYPIIKDLQISYSYNKKYLSPDLLYRISGKQKINLYTENTDQNVFVAFLPMSYDGNGFYMGFDKKPENGPMGILFVLNENTNMNPMNIRFEYSTADGFQLLKVIDQTNRLTDSGILFFMPPDDFSMIEIEEKKRYYIRIKDITGELSKENVYHPTIRNIYLNAVPVQNIETLDEEEFYIDTISSNMKFFLNTSNILYCEVYVNEFNKYSPAQMHFMIANNKLKIKAEYNFLGEIISFYVLWSEVENFDNSTIEDRHYVIDRMKNTINFGDGVNVMIPNNINSVAFTVKTTSCSGAMGNVDVGNIHTASSNIMFVGDIYNPMKAYGGNDIETVDKALERGASAFSNRHRLISELDYVREVKAYFVGIDQVKVICGKNINGEEKNGRINIVILMKDFMNGASSFYHIQDDLKQYLINKCEITVRPEELFIIEPVFLKISVEVWVEIEYVKDAFNVRRLLLKKLNEFFHPILSENAEGHPIGMLPSDQQIITMLYSTVFDGRIKQYVVTSSYTDSNGVHDIDMNQLGDNPFVVCVNGKHKIHMADIADMM